MGGHALRVVVVILLALFALPAVAQEAITDFASAITLQTDGTVDVTETITVNAQGIEIRHGIYRDIPTVLRNDDGSKVRSNLDVLAVTRDGQSEPYAIENFGGASVVKRIRIGDADTFVSTGTHRYTIHYTMTRMARRFADHDELFWNVTGNYWVFPIDSAVASVTLPPGATIQKLIGYTGRPGSLEQAVTVTRTSDTTAIFRTTRVLRGGDNDGTPSEGLSVALAFPTGVLAEPGGAGNVLDWLSDHRDSVLSALSVAIVLLYNLLAWNTVGRDPRKGIIIPLFHPPADVSPPLIHYVNRMGWQKSGWTAFTAAIFDLGVKGLVAIDNAAKKLTVTVTGKLAPKLPAGEDVLFGYFTANRSITVNTSNGPDLNRKRGAMVKVIEAESGQRYFRNNYGYVALGIVIGLACLGVMVLADVLDPVFLFVAVIGGAVIGVVAAAFAGRSGAGRGLGGVIFIVWAAILGINLIGSFGNVLTTLSFDVALVAALSVVVINVVFAVLMRAPTVEGRKLMDQIDGFKMYLETAEKNRLNIQNEPPMTVERFEAILPYAIALGVEKPWSDHFEGELARNAVSDVPAGGYAPIWYSGRDWSTDARSFSNSISAVAAGMSAAMIAAQPASSSSSGFSGGGGGGSGGGGGGGGGGGW